MTFAFNKFNNNNTIQTDRQTISENNNHKDLHADKRNSIFKDIKLDICFHLVIKTHFCSIGLKLDLKFSNTVKINMSADC